MRSRTAALGATFCIPVLVLLGAALPHIGEGSFRSDSAWYGALGLDAWRRAEPFALSSGAGQPFFNKPPLAIAAHGLALHVLGVSLWAARLPSVLAACGCVVATVGVVRSLATSRAACLSGIILALTYEFFRRTHEISLDLWQCAFMLAGAWVFVAGSRSRLPWSGALAGIPLGLALLCKPLTALLAVAALAPSAVRGRSGRVLVAAGVLAVAVGAPWHLSMRAEFRSRFTGQYFGREIADRARGGLVGGQPALQRPTFYAEQIARGYWPWFVPAALGAWCAVRRGRPDPARRWAIAWFIVWFGALSAFPDRRDRYGVPLYPALAALGGCWLAFDSARSWRRAISAGRRWAAPCAVICGAIASIAPIRLHSPDDPQWARLFRFLRSHPSEWVFEGASDGAPGARVYLETGRWPVPTRDELDAPLAEPPFGAMLFYHRRGGRAPGPGERVVFEAGDLKVTRLEAPAWRPESAPDPGE